MKKEKFNNSKIHYPGKPGSEFWRSAKHAVKTASPKSTTGKFIVIDGTDGSGKATQVELLREHLVKDGYKVQVINFPQYYNNFFGKFIGHCLSEQYYNFLNTHPKIISVLFAADRWESKEKIDGWLKKGYIVLADRYTSAAQIHQGGMIKNVKKRADFIKWLNQMEYEVFKIPKPNVTFYLSLPIPIILKLIAERDSKIKREYLKKKKDVFENDVEFLTNSRKSAMWLFKREKGWIKIDCADKKGIRTREDIHNEVYQKVKKILK